VFLTYGDARFRQSRKRIITESKQIGLFTDHILETKEIVKDQAFGEALDSNEFKKVFNVEKGGGCYIWKPYVIYKNLLLLSRNDILVYADAGCTIHDDKKSKDKFCEYFDSLNDSKGVLGFRSHHIESEMAKGDVFEYFGAMDNKDLHGTPKFSAGRHFVRKCDHSMSLYEKWWDIARSEPHLFDRSPSKAKNFPNFMRHIWDTGTWSLLCKTMGVVDQPWTEEEMPIKGTRIIK
jgi:hypothetical protein